MKENAFSGISEYSQLSGWFRTAAIIGRFILDIGDHIERIEIGGGSDDVYDTGDVAFDARYSNLNVFVQNCRRDYEMAKLAARQKYGSWFSGLNYHFIKIRTHHYTVRIGSGINVDIPESSNSNDYILFLKAFVEQFGA